MNENQSVETTIYVIDSELPLLSNGTELQNFTPVF